MKLNKNKLKKITILILAFVVVITIITTIFSNVCINISEYTINLSGFSGSARVVVISDLHGKEYGEDNRLLLTKISEQKPDAIFVVGDMLDDSDAETGFTKTTKLLIELLDVAPVYFSYGNQERNTVVI